MLFTNEQRRRIRLGEMTATIRAWAAARVKPGKRYRFDDDHDVAIKSVDQVERDRLTDGDLAAAGFRSHDAFLAELPKFAGDRADGPFYYVRFVLETRTEAPSATPADIDRLVTRLARMDRLSRHGPWTRDALAVIAANPRVVSTELARELGRERFAFKTDVRKLKALGLTRSFDVGYELTALGRQLVTALTGDAVDLHGGGDDE